MLDALEHLHNRNFLHRDIKPANFVFKDSTCNQIMMIDLGLAKYGGEEGELVRYFADVTETDESVGPRHIFSPELIAYSSDKLVIVDYRSDLWQFSRVLWFYVTGDLSIGRPSPRRDPSSGRIAGFVDNMMFEDPNDRIQTIAEIRELIRAVQEEG